jgi:hypothetical protein
MDGREDRREGMKKTDKVEAVVTYDYLKRRAKQKEANKRADKLIEKCRVEMSEQPTVVTLLAQIDMLKLDREGYERMRKSEVALGTFFREQYVDEIERGEHAGMSLDEVVIRYLSRERRVSKGGMRVLLGMMVNRVMGRK